MKLSYRLQRNKQKQHINKISITVGLMKWKMLLTKLQTLKNLFSPMKLRVRKLEDSNLLERI